MTLLATRLQSAIKTAMDAELPISGMDSAQTAVLEASRDKLAKAIASAVITEILTNAVIGTPHGPGTIT
jgi:hypothetical protein